MRKDVIEILKKAEWMRRQVELVEECLEELTPEEAVVVDCLMEEGNGKIMAVCTALDVSERTAYRQIDRVKDRISQLFERKGVTIS